MSTFALIIMFTFMAMTVVVLMVGLGAMVIGGDFNKRHANKLMFMRVTFQALTLLMLGMMFLAN